MGEKMVKKWWKMEHSLERYIRKKNPIVNIHFSSFFLSLRGDPLPYI